MGRSQLEQHRRYRKGYNAVRVLNSLLAASLIGLGFMVMTSFMQSQGKSLIPLVLQ
jgi:hypothetical protein